MATDFIVDFETLGVTDDSVLLSVGILPCPDISGTYTVKDLISSGLYIKFNREQQYKAGRKIDSSEVGSGVIEEFAEVSEIDETQKMIALHTKEKLDEKGVTINE